MKINTVKTLAFLLILLGSQLFAQNYSIKQYRVKEGLSSNFVECIGQDSTGFMWIGAKNGLNRFDGKAFHKGRIEGIDKTFIYGKSVFALHRDKAGNFWAGTDALGLVKYNYAKDIFEQIPIFKDPQLKIERKTVLRIDEDKNGDLWILTHFSIGKYVVKEKKMIWFSEFRKAGHNDVSSANSIAITSDNKKWVSFYEEQGLTVFNEKLNIFESFPIVVNGTEPNLNIKSIKQINATTLLLGCEGQGLIALDINSHQGTVLKGEEDGQNSLNTDVVFSLLKKSADIYLIGTINGGLHEFNFKTKSFTAIQLLSDKIKSTAVSSGFLFKDNEENVWVGTHSEGLFIIKKNPNGITTVSNESLSGAEFCQRPVSAFFRDSKGKFWVTVDGCGVSVLNPQTNAWKHYSETDGLTSMAVLSMIELPDETIWMSTWGGGVNVYNPKTDRFTAFSPSVPGTVTSYNVKYLLFDGKYVWIGTHGDGLNMYDWETKEFITSTTARKGPFNLKEALPISHLYKDSKNYLWISTSNGLYMYDKRKMHTFLLDPAKKNSIISNYVGSVCEDSKGNLWAGTMEGLCLYNYSSRSFVATKQPLLQGTIKSMISDEDGYLWISVDSKIVKYDSEKDSVMSLLEVDAVELPPYFERAGFVDENGDLYFGHAFGYTKINPAEVRTDLSGLKILLSTLRINNVRIDPYLAQNPTLGTQLSMTSAIVLEPEQNNISIDFVMLDPTNKGEYLYSYMLEGFDDKWQEAGDQNRAVYTNLSPGKYSFRVKARNVIGQEVASSKALEIEILPAWWQALWFKITMICCILLLFFGIIEWRVKAYKKQIRLKASEVATNEQSF